MNPADDEPADLQAHSVSELLAVLATEARQQPLHLSDLVDRFGPRGFGVLLLLVTLPTFLPLPVGAITGPLCALIGLQLLFLQSHPWLPGKIRQQPLDGKRLQQFLDRRGRWLQRLERLARPRWPLLTSSRLAQAINGLLIAISGVLLSLPIPFTNYPLGVLMLLFCLALLERDGRLMVVAWILSLVAAGVFVLLSQQVLDLLGRLLG